MKRMFLCVGVLFLSVLSYSQSALEVNSPDEKVRFYLMLDGQQMNNFYETNVRISNISSGRHKIRVVFEADTVADYVEKIFFTANKKENYQVAAKGKPRKVLDDLGRDAGAGFNIGAHDSSFAYLVDSYYITRKNSESYKPGGNEIEIDTEQSASTSVLPASKQRPGDN